MKYSDLIQFEPITEVVKFGRLSDGDYRKSLVKNFVFSKAYEKTIIPELCKNLDYSAKYETFGLQIVGNFGTGKSHLMSLFSLVAEDSEYLSLVNNESAKKNLSTIAGKYKVIRFELGSKNELWDIVCYQIDRAFQEWGVDYSIQKDITPDMYSDKLNRMMAYFENKFPDKGLMIIIDEMLSYLKGRATDDRLNRDLAVLQALGQASDNSKFRMVFGVQELIYTTPQFQYAANMLGRVNQRYREITITEQDVQFVVQQRLLLKNDSQKSAIRSHLMKFTEFFTDIHSNLEDYVNLFPVNPSFFKNFQQIKVGKSQREVLKTLSNKFNQIKNNEVPEDQPGLICYDHYWDDLNVPSMMTIPDVSRVSEIMSTVHQKIDENFTAARAKKAPLAHRIANACAVKILQDNLERTNGTNVENLVDDLCYLDATCLDREFLMEVINTTASQIVTATVGQYFEKNERNQEYHLRVEGGVNYEQKIKDYIPTMDVDKKDRHFFNFLSEYLPIETEQYRREFKIYRHRIEWKSHKTMLEGYIFMGNPAERSTTQPQQNFYIYFMPIFNKENIKHGNEPDSVYVHFDKCSNEFKEYLELYAAAEEQIASVDSSQKAFYEQYKKQYVDKLKGIFQHDFVECTEFQYQGEVQAVTPQMMAGNAKDQVISNVSSILLEDWFNKQMPDYPKFTLLKGVLSPDNRDLIMKGARMRIANPTQQNKDGEAILAGLGLIHDGNLSIEGCQYAISIKKKLENKGEGQVLNRDEILHRFYKEWEGDWRSNDYGLEADMEFLVLATMVALAEIEIDLQGGKTIHAANLKEFVDMPKDVAYSFSHVRKPKGINLSLVRSIFLGITKKDYTSQIQNPEIYPELITEAAKIAGDAARLSHEVRRGIYLENIEILDSMESMNLSNRLDALRGFCDRIQIYNTPAKMRNLPWTQEQVTPVLAAIAEIDKTKKTLIFVEDFRSRLSYLSQAKQYVTEQKMSDAIDAAVGKVGEIIKVMNDEQKVNAYKSELDSLIGQYADWYLAEYKRLHLTAMEDTEKRKIMNSNEKSICDAVCGADHGKGYFSVAVQYAEWNRKMSELNVASSNVTKEAILRAPYLGFNPSQYKGKTLPKLSDMKTELANIEENVDKTLHQILADKELLKNVVILDAGEHGLLDRFNGKKEELSPSNASRLVEIVNKLHKGVHPIEISCDTIRTVLNRPMTPEDAIAAFRKYINSLTVGSKDENIRIIMK